MDDSGDAVEIYEDVTGNNAQLLIQHFHTLTSMLHRRPIQYNLLK